MKNYFKTASFQFLESSANLWNFPLKAVIYLRILSKISNEFLDLEGIYGMGMVILSNFVENRMYLGKIQDKQQLMNIFNHSQKLRNSAKLCAFGRKIKTFLNLFKQIFIFLIKSLWKIDLFAIFDQIFLLKYIPLR